jgi:integrase/recombinase XerC
MPRTRGPRTRLERGIYQDSRGYELQVMVAGQRRSQRLPLGTSRAQLRATLAALVTDLRRQAPTTAAVGRATLAADAPRYLAAVRAMPSYSDRRRDIEAWVAVVGDRPRHGLSSADIATQLHRWRQAGAAAQTCNHRRTALSQLYAVLDGRDAPNPARAVPKFPTPAPLPRALPVGAVRAILRQLRKDGKTRARLAVIASTGVSHAELGRLRPADVQLEAGVLLVGSRRKGKGSAPRLIPLTRRAKAALRLFVRLQCWGRFSRSSLHKAFRRACVAAGYGDTDWRPYDLRHTFGTEVVLATGDERAAQVLLGHASLSTTSRYTLGAAQARAAAAIAAMDRARR